MVRGTGARVVGVVALVLVIAACGARPVATPAATALTQAEVRPIAESMLNAWNTCDYGAWSRDWSDALREGIPEQAFHDFCEQTRVVTGDFMAIESIEPTPAQTAGMTRWNIHARFQNSPHVLTIVMPDSGGSIEGVFFDQP